MNRKRILKRNVVIKGRLEPRIGVSNHLRDVNLELRLLDLLSLAVGVAVDGYMLESDQREHVIIGVNGLANGAFKLLIDPDIDSECLILLEFEFVAFQVFKQFGG